MNKLTNQKEQIWITLCLVPPIIILGKLGNGFTDNSLNRLLLAGLFGSLGGLIGGGLFYLVKTKTVLIKTISVLLLSSLCAATVIVVKKNNKPLNATCEVCGYKAIGKNQKRCQYCRCLIWEEYKKYKSYNNNKKEWLKDLQLLWFSLDSSTQKVDFYNPVIDEGFEKDKNWHPVITPTQLIDDFNME